MPSPAQTPSTTGDVLYETFFAGAIGGSVIALLFLVSDAVRGHPLLTPSLLGSTLLFDLPLRTGGPIRLDAVAAFTAVHFAAFAVLGLIGSLLVRTMEAREARPVWVTLVLFGLMEAGFVLPVRALAPELLSTLGHARVVFINLAAAASMVGFLHHARAEEAKARTDMRRRSDGFVAGLTGHP